MTGTEKKWRARVEAWTASGLSCKEYAARAELNPRTLTWWKSKLARNGELEATEPARFVEVTEQRAAEAEAGMIELDVGGIRVRLQGRIEAEALTRVLDVLEARR